MESILRSFPEYIKVKDLPHEDITYKVNHFPFLSLRFSLLACYNVVFFRWRSNFIVTVPCFAYFFFRLTWSLCFTRRASSSESEILIRDSGPVL